MGKKLLLATALALFGFAPLLVASTAYAGVTAVSLGRVNPADYPDMVQPSPTATTSTTGGTWTAPNAALVQVRSGQTAASPNQSNDGWNPWGQNGQGGYAGPSDTTHEWINVGASDAAGLFSLTGYQLAIVWGSPNNDNTVTFYADASGTDPIGSIDETSLFTSSENTGAPGFLVKFSSTEMFDSVSFAATNGSAFEFAIVAVPEPSTWAMMMLGFAGLGFAGYRSSRQPVSIVG